jgi:hydrogenase/urease accessory protein HupE
MTRLELAARYVALGFTHILPKGLDHVLFVLGVFLLSRRIRPILMQVSAFTIAHSITLGLSMYGLVSVSPSIVEPLIALSIAYIAIENLLLAKFRPWRVALVFAFGLLHGLGFAGALKEVGLPRSEFVTALIGNAALGQLAVITAAFLAVGYWYGDRIGASSDRPPARRVRAWASSDSAEAALIGGSGWLAGCRKPLTGGILAHTPPGHHSPVPESSRDCARSSLASSVRRGEDDA